MKMWKGKGNNNKLLFSQKELEILHQEIRGQLNEHPIVMENLNRQVRTANKQHTINQSYKGKALLLTISEGI